MDNENIRLAYAALEGQSCEECGVDFDFNRLKISDSDTSDFSANYRCEACSQHYDISLDVRHDKVKLVLREDNGELVRVTRPSRGELFQSGHHLDKLIREFHNLNSSFNLLSINLERIRHWQNELPDIFRQISGKSLSSIEQNMPTQKTTISVGTDANWRFLHTDLHNYLSTAYTFDQNLETIRPKMVWDAPVEQKFHQYKVQSRVTLGLRHFVQHEGVIPLSFRRNKDGSDRATDVLTTLSEVEVMGSQIPFHPPDGYKKGSEYHYSEIEGPYVNISHRVMGHFVSCGKLVQRIGESALEKHGEEIEEYESFQNDFLNYDDLDHPEELREVNQNEEDDKT